MIPGKVSCLMATYGRYTNVCRALACFLSQDYDDAELVILNNHPATLSFDHPKVRIVNEPGHATLGHCRQRLLDFADGEFCRTWDDDFYLPWAISQGVEGTARWYDRAAWHYPAAWKPSRSWATNGIDSIKLEHNAFEAAVTWRTAFVKKHGYRLGMGDEHRPLLDAIGTVPQNDMGIWASYLYCWGLGDYHASGSLGNGQSVEQRTAAWMAHNNDTGNGQPLVPSDLLPWYRRIVRCIQPELQNAWMLAALGIGPAHAPPAKWGIKPPRPGKLVVTAGCFDVLHPGHVAFLQWARAQGDYLAVLLNDDHGVELQKGKDRPIVPYAGRWAALMGLDCVDAVVNLPGINEQPILDRLGPNLLVVKGCDYGGKESIVPRPAGCEVRIAPPMAFAKHTSDLVGAI